MNAVKISPLTSKLKPSATLAINEQIAIMREKGETIFHMGFGESPFPVHPTIQQALAKNANRKSYLPTQGIFELREKISEFYLKMFNISFSPNQIVVGPGSKILLLDALMALEGPLLLPAPSWVSYQHQAKLLGKNVYHLHTSPESSYLITPEILENTIQQKISPTKTQKLLLLNYPCNPTGQNFSVTQLKELASIARDFNIIILSDEIYGLISFKGHEHHSISEFYPEGTLVTGGLSKDRSLGGFRLGVMLLPENERELLRAMLSIGSESWSCASAPIQYAAIDAYSMTSEMMNHIRDCTAIHEIITMYVHRRFVEAGIRCSPPQGAFYLFPDWNEFSSKLSQKDMTSSKNLSDDLLRNWKVATLPGSEFGMPESDLCTRIATVDYDGAAALKIYQENPNEALKDAENFVHSVAPRVVGGCDQIEKFTKSTI